MIDKTGRYPAPALAVAKDKCLFCLQKRWRARERKESKDASEDERIRLARKYATELKSFDEVTTNVLISSTHSREVRPTNMLN